MKTGTLVLLGSCLLGLGLGTAQANAGPCTTEIERLTKTLSAHDAGSGPTAGAQGAAPTATTQAAPSGQHPPTSAMGRQGDGAATSPEDVRRQTQGRPTAAQEAGPGQASAGANMENATAALQRARDLDGQGKETECMAAAREADQHIGSK
ncbi:hypothetical protein [Terrihabitans sp. B22-R8]|uniref:hypothetical protein n=1 Tax=Terrihabitans sp. B22-R8 TaxID=3425128 RepID=UPI00403CA21B